MAIGGKLGREGKRSLAASIMESDSKKDTRKEVKVVKSRL